MNGIPAAPNNQERRAPEQSVSLEDLLIQSDRCLNSLMTGLRDVFLFFDEDRYVEKNPNAEKNVKYIVGIAWQHDPSKNKFIFEISIKWSGRANDLFQAVEKRAALMLAEYLARDREAPLSVTSDVLVRKITQSFSRIKKSSNKDDLPFLDVLLAAGNRLSLCAGELAQEQDREKNAKSKSSAQENFDKAKNEMRITRDQIDDIRYWTEAIDTILEKQLGQTEEILSALFQGASNGPSALAKMREMDKTIDPLPLIRNDNDTSTDLSAIPKQGIAGPEIETKQIISRRSGSSNGGPR